MKQLLFVIAIFSQISQATTPKVIYGEDDRRDSYQGKSKKFQLLAESTAAQIPRSAINIKGSTAEIYAKALKEWVPRGMTQPVCEKERFSGQPTAANCSGFFVGDDLFVTAGHCMLSQSECQRFSWVRNYKVLDETDSSVSVNASDVFECRDIIKVGYGKGLDFALIRLDRDFKGKPVKISKSKPTLHTPVVMIGYPSGLPQKITDGAQITAISEVSFKTNLDAFGGNSGSAVFHAESGELLGILVNGQRDYRHNAELNCSEVNVLTDDKAGEGVSSFEQFESVLNEHL